MCSLEIPSEDETLLTGQTEIGPNPTYIPWLEANEPKGMSKKKLSTKSDTRWQSIISQ